MLRIIGCIKITVKVHEILDVSQNKVNPENTLHLYKYCLLKMYIDSYCYFTVTVKIH